MGLQTKGKIRWSEVSVTPYYVRAKFYRLSRGKEVRSWYRNTTVVLTIAIE